MHLNPPKPAVGCAPYAQGRWHETPLANAASPSQMILPSELRGAISAPGGGKITLVVGAGCSFEAPTSIPLAGTCSQECHDRLVANGVLAPGDCAAPTNLSCLADTLVSKGATQRPLVEQLSRNYPFKAATPNEGHCIAAALLGEGAIASVVTLNFDLALTHAIGALGVGDVVGIIERPEDLRDQKVVNLYYLHRNVNAADPETWILRTEALKNEWKGSWEAVVAAKVLATPVVVFAGLGSPADVLIESTKLIQKAIPNANTVYQVDPADQDKSEFSKALALDPDAFVKANWGDFMTALSERLVLEQTTQLRTAADALVTRDGLAAEDITGLLKRLEEIGLVRFGSLRASWLLHNKPYCRDEAIGRELIADLLLTASMVARVTGATAVLCEDGVVDFCRDDRTVASHLFVSGHGARSRLAIESELSARRRRFRGRPTPPSGAVVAGTRNNATAVTTPVDVVLGSESDSIVTGQSTLQIFLVESLRADPNQCKQVAP